MKFNVPFIILVTLVLFATYQWVRISQQRSLQYRYPLRDVDASSAGKEIEEREEKDKKFLIRVLTIAVVLIVWLGIWSPTNQFNTEMKLEASQKLSYLSEYEAGWNDQCEALFFRLGGIENYAFGRGIKLSYPQCLSLKNTSSANNAFNEHIGGYISDSSDYEMKESGRNQANRDLLDEIFSMSPYWCYGADCLVGSDFGIFRP